MVERRAPFSDNPQVGARGERTSRRILDATRTVLGRTGYHRCSVELIAQEAGCSRPTFYQYFASKEVAFAQLASGLADRLRETAERLKPITAEAGGWDALRDWMDEYAAVYDEHEAVFHNFSAAALADENLSRQLVREARDYHRAVGNQIIDPHVPPTMLDEVLDVLSATLVRTLYDASTLRRSGIGGPRKRLLDAYSDVFHRTMFGLIPDVNVHAHRIRPTPGLRLLVVGDDASADGTTRAALMAAGHEVLSEFGFHGTTIDAIVERAGVAHGTFYRYFRNKELLTQELLNEASIKLSVYFSELVTLLASGSSVDGVELRRWLERYTRAQMSEMAILRVWSDAVLVDEDLLADAAPMLEWGRRQLARPLAARGFRGEEVDAMVMVALVDSLGADERSPAALEAAAHIVERGFLGIQAAMSSRRPRRR